MNSSGPIHSFSVFTFIHLSVDPCLLMHFWADSLLLVYTFVYISACVSKSPRSQVTGRVSARLHHTAHASPPLQNTPSPARHLPASTWRHFNRGGAGGVQSWILFTFFLHLRFLHTWAHKGWWWCCLLLVTRKRSEARPLSALSRERAWKKNIRKA